MMFRILVLLFAVFSNLYSQTLPDNTVVYKHTNQGDLHLDLFFPENYENKEKFPTIVFFHGGAWKQGSPKQFYPQCEYLSSRGMICASVEYRIFNTHQTSPMASVRDAKSSIRFLKKNAKKFKIDTSRLVAAGGSAGGHLAAATGILKGFDEVGEDLSISTVPSAMILLNPVIDTSINGFGYNRIKKRWKDFSPLHNIDVSAPQTLIIHGSKDKLVPVATIKSFQSKMKKYGINCQVNFYKNEEHGFYRQNRFQEVLNDIDQYLVGLGYIEEKALKKDKASVTVGKLTQHNTIEVSPLFFGINTLYWVDDDNARENEKYNRLLKALNFSVMRYPGGEVADNFNWMTNELYDKNSFPYSINIMDPKTRMDFDEFVEWKNSFGAEAIVVVNLEQGFIEGDIEKAAEMAAAWVRYANIEKQYNIKYWEIGNETYYLGTRYALSGKDYAKALKLFSKKMKAVDSSIHIGANGPTDATKIPIISRLSDQQIKKLRSSKDSRERQKFRKNFKNIFFQDNDRFSWWEEVVNNAQNDFDFVIIHNYPPRKLGKEDLKNKWGQKKTIDRFSSFFEKRLGRRVPIAITEYNLSHNSSGKDMLFRLSVAEMIGEYLKANVFMTNYWPVRKIEGKRALFDLDSYDPKPIYYIYKAFSTFMGNRVIHTKNTDDIYTIATLDTDKNLLTVFIINKMDEVKDIDISLGSRVTFLQAQKITENKIQLHDAKDAISSINSQAYVLKANPLSFNIIQFKMLDKISYDLNH